VRFGDWHFCTAYAAVIMVAGVAGCGNRPSSETSASRPAAEVADVHFMGVSDRVKLYACCGNSADSGMTVMSKVTPATAAEYRRRKADGGIVAEETRGGFVYFAVISASRGSDVDDADVVVTERYRAPATDEP
jgi:hypothetical protein